MKTITLFLTILFAAGLIGSRAQDTWTQKADFGGTGRSTAVGFSIGDKGYIGLGANGSLQTIFKDFWEYDPATDAWTQKADFGGDARGLAVGLSINGKGYVGLGTTRVVAGSVIYYKDFWEYNPETNVWTQKADFGGAARAYAAGFAVDGKVYMGAGSAFIPDEVFYPDFWQYDPATDIWTQKADFGERTAPTTFAIGDKGYMGLGFKFSGSWWQTDFYEYAPATDTWTKKASFPGLGRESPARFVIGTKGYLGPGYGSFSNINDFWEYDASVNKWTQKNDFAGPDRSYAVGFSIGTKGYIGTGGGSGGDLKDFWEYTPETTTACTVPTGLTTANITGTSAKLKWNAVEGVPGYAVRYKVTGTQTWTYKMATTSAKNITGLLPNTSYTWSVKTFCSVDHPGVSSKWASVQTFTTGAFKLADEQSTTLNVYPNPTSGQFRIAITLSDEETSSAMIQVINALGQIVYNEKTSVASGMLLQEINLKDLPAGMYLVKVIVNDQVYSAPINYSK